MKLLIIGHGRHGKDTVCEILRDGYKMHFKSSSEFCADLFIYDVLKDQYGYASAEECYNDRHNHRSEWFHMIADYCKDDAGRLGRAIFSSHDVYCGLRNNREFHAMKNAQVFDYAIWVDRSMHLPLESTDSMNLEEWMADYTIDNNGSMEGLLLNVQSLMKTLNIK